MATDVADGVGVAVAMRVFFGRRVAVAVGVGLAVGVGVVVCVGVAVAGIVSSSSTCNGAAAMLTGSPPYTVTDHWPTVSISGASLMNLKRPCASAVVTPRLSDFSVDALCMRSSSVTLTPAGQSAPTTVSEFPCRQSSGTTAI